MMILIAIYFESGARGLQGSQALMIPVALIEYGYTLMLRGFTG